MIDDDLEVFLIEVNTNPCLDTSPCPLLHRLITQILDQTFKIAVDPFLRGRDSHYINAQEMSVSEINFEMIVSNFDKLNRKHLAKKVFDKNATEPIDISEEGGNSESKPSRLNNSNSQIEPCLNDVIMDPDEPEFTPFDDDGLQSIKKVLF